VEQLTEIVREFLDLTRIEAGELRLDLESVDIAALLDDVLARIDGQMKGHEISIRVQVDADVPAVLADAVRLRAVFDNILSNALKYTPHGGRISVEGGRLSAADASGSDGVSIRIADSGPGVPPAFRSRIFDKFFRLEHHQTGSRIEARGAGIGLYLCRQIVELHGGTIACDSGIDGHGTSITITLPRARSASDPSSHLALRTEVDAREPHVNV
jgi:NtrC-family two-component system sensor histidine kinase KinB